MRLRTLAILTASAMTILSQPLQSQDRAGWLLVANKNDQSLGIIDPISHKQVATVPVGGVTGHEVAASPDGTRAFVPIFGNSGVGKPGTDGQHIAVIDLAARKVERTFAFAKGVRPHHPVIGPADGLLYVTTEIDNSVSIIDPKTMRLVGSVPTGQPESHMLAISSDGTKGYTANVGPGTVSVLDLVGRKTLAIVPVATHVQRIALSVDDRWAFTSDTTTPRLAVIDARTNTVARWVTLPQPGYGAAATPDGRFLVITLPAANAVGIVDLATFTVARTVSTPDSPQEVVMRPDGRVAYVSCDVPGKIAAISTADWSVLAIVDAGRYADGLAWASAAQ
jgi:YVTN family beta-propeller protein